MYRAQACGRERDNGQWEAWLEFKDLETGEVFCSQRETTQPNRRDAAYWAAGLTPVYLEGALERILNPPVPRVVQAAPPPNFDGPAPRSRGVVSNRNPVIDPFSVYAKHPDLLPQQLAAFRGWHLRQIIRDYDLVDAKDGSLESLSEAELRSLIVRRVRDLHA